MFPLLAFSLLKEMTRSDYAGYAEWDFARQDGRGTVCHVSSRDSGVMGTLMRHRGFREGLPGGREAEQRNGTAPAWRLDAPVGWLAEGGPVMWTAFAVEGGRIFLGMARSAERDWYDDEDRLAAERALPHLQRVYGLARERSIARLSLRERLGWTFSELTPRQLDVLAWLAQGKSNEGIARLIGIGVEGVKSHLQVIFDRLGVEGRLGAALLAQSAKPAFLPSSSARPL